MYQVFKSLIVSDIVIKNIDLYGCIVSINRRLSNDIVRKRLTNCFIEVRKYDKNGIHFNKNETSHWLGYLLHRDNDLPSIIGEDLREWYQYGKLHRDNDKPAVVYANYQEWYQYGKLHRDNDKPAYTSKN